MRETLRLRLMQLHLHLHLLLHPWRRDVVRALRGGGVMMMGLELSLSVLLL